MATLDGESGRDACSQRLQEFVPEYVTGADGRS
jgi:hypothetical protein